MSNTKKIDQVFRRFSDYKRSGTLSGREFMRLMQSAGFDVEFTSDAGAGHCIITHPALPPELGTSITLTHGLKGDVLRVYIKHICKYVFEHEEIIREYLNEI